MKHTKLLLLVVLFLASCAAPATLAPTQIFTPEPTATQAPTQTPSPTPTLVPTPTQIGGGAGRLIFELDSAQFSKIFPDLKGEVNVFTANMDGTNLVPITDGMKDYNYVENISPDGTKVLIDSSSKEFFEGDRNDALYLIDLTQTNSGPVKLAGGFLHDRYYEVQGKIAKFFGKNQVIYIGQGVDGYGIYMVNIDGSNPKTISSNALGITPVEILAVDSERVYWGSAIQDSIGNFGLAIRSSSLDGSSQSKLMSNGTQVISTSVAFSADGSMIAWVEEATPTFHHNYLNIASVSDINSPEQLSMLTGQTILNWWPDGSKILVLDLGSILLQKIWNLDTTSNLFGIYEVSSSSPLQVTNYHLSDILIKNYGAWLYDFSPDGQHILISSPVDDGTVSSLDFATVKFDNVLNGLHPTGVHWLP